VGGAEAVEQVGVARVLQLEEGAALGRVARVLGVHGGQGVVARRVDEGLDREAAHVVLEGRDLGLLGVDGGDGGGVGGVGLVGGPLGLGQEGLLAAHVGLQVAQGPVDLGVGGLEGVDVAGHLGLAGPHLGPLGGGVAAGAGTRVDRRDHHHGDDEQGAERPRPRLGGWHPVAHDPQRPHPRSTEKNNRNLMLHDGHRNHKSLVPHGSIRPLDLRCG
jgi:hypothetical protein